MVAIASARRHDRSIFHVFKDIMSSDSIARETKKAMCRGVLECPDEVRRMAERVAELRSDSRAKGSNVVPSTYLAIESPVFYKFHGSLKRHAVVALVENGGEPLREVIDEYFLKSHGDSLSAIAMTEGAVDLIRAHGDDLDQDKVKRLLSRAIKLGLGPVRLAAYARVPSDSAWIMLEPALKDSARMVRDWAGKYLSANKPRRHTRSQSKSV